MGRITRRRLDDPDDVRDLGLLVVNILRIGPMTIGFGTVQPGWRWSTHMRRETGEPLCQIHHLQLLLAGRFGVRLEDGEEVEISPNEIFDVPPGHDAWVIGDEPALIVDFLGNIDRIGLPATSDRVVTTLLMTDIVDSTAIAARLGDQVWRQTLAEHNQLVRGRLERYLGREVNTTGDGFLAMFASARAAIGCAIAIRDATLGIGLPVRIGVHTGEVELLPGDIGGVAVHAAARVTGLAGASEIIVSASTKNLVDETSIGFEPRGTRQLKGIPTPIEVFAVVP